MSDVRRLPMALEFDFDNCMDAFGALATAPSGERKIIVNMAAILWLCAAEPEEQWREIVAETVLHEVLHAIQDELGRGFTEGEIDAAIDKARGLSAEEVAGLPDAARSPELDVYETTLARAEAAEARCATLEKELLDVRARLVLAEHHKSLSLMGRSSYAEVVEDGLRTKLAEAELRAEQAESDLAACRGELQAVEQVLPDDPRRGVILLDRVTALVVQHQFDNGRCETWEREANEARADRDRLAAALTGLRDYVERERDAAKPDRDRMRRDSLTMVLAELDRLTAEAGRQG